MLFCNIRAGVEYRFYRWNVNYPKVKVSLRLLIASCYIEKAPSETSEGALFVLSAVTLIFKQLPCKHSKMSAVVVLQTARTIVERPPAMDIVV